MSELFGITVTATAEERPDLNKTYDILIVGAGPSGLTAAIYSGRSKLETLIIEKLSPGGEIATSEWIDNYPGFPGGIAGSELANLFKKQALRFGAKIISAEVKKVEWSDKIFTLQTDAGQIRGKAVIVSTGADPVKLPLPEEEKFRGKGIAYCATCDAAFFKDKPVAVIGGGDTAVHEAIYLSKFASKLYLVHRRNELRAVKMLQEEILNNPKVIPELGFVPSRVLGEKKVEGLEIENVITHEKKILDVNGIFVAIGIIPNSSLVKDLALIDEKGHIIVNSKMETSVSGLYAAGDVRNTPLRQVVTACGDGAIAAFQAEQYIKNL